MRRVTKDQVTHNVQDDIHIHKVRVDITRAGAKQRLRSAPCERSRRLVDDVQRDLAAAKVPDLDGVVGPLHGVHSAADGVEVVAVRGRVGGRRRVVAARVGIDAAVGAEGSACGEVVTGVGEDTAVGPDCFGKGDC